MSVDADKEDKPIDRLAFFFIGGLTGLGYGVVLALLHALITNSFHVSIILWSTFVFA
ncbi:MAG: hypothetical protein JNM52_04360, partial [Betaproteobacteria bacterium]|nr:hypothetical protein [Betaproteobacteria bacterium]